MHIPDGFLNTPTWSTLYAVSGGTQKITPLSTYEKITPLSTYEVDRISD